MRRSGKGYTGPEPGGLRITLRRTVRLLSLAPGMLLESTSLAEETTPPPEDLCNQSWFCVFAGRRPVSVSKRVGIRDRYG